MAEDARYVDDETFAEWEAWQREGLEEERAQRVRRHRSIVVTANRVQARDEAYRERIDGLLAEVDWLQAEVERLRRQVRYERWIAELATGARP